MHESIFFEHDKPGGQVPFKRIIPEKMDKMCYAPCMGKT